MPFIVQSHLPPPFPKEPNVNLRGTGGISLITHTQSGFLGLRGLCFGCVAISCHIVELSLCGRMLMARKIAVNHIQPYVFCSSHVSFAQTSTELLVYMNLFRMSCDKKKICIPATFTVWHFILCYLMSCDAVVILSYISLN